MADLQKKLTILPDNPLCGISTYKDTLNLATGACTRQIKKLVLTGEEDIDKNTQSASDYTYYFSRSYLVGRGDVLDVKCTHLNQIPTPGANAVGINTTTNQLVVYINIGSTIMNAQPSGNTVAGLKEYLAAQYANSTPVTIWYILATPTTETVTVPSGLSGTEEGYLNQSGTPTPTNPIYPTANNVEIWLHSLRKLTTATDTITTLPADLYADGTNATIGLVGNMSQAGTPTPQNPLQPQECGDLETTGTHAGQYKIPISSASTTTPVYLGEVETTRKIKKFVITGNEGWKTAMSDNTKHYLDVISPDYLRADNQITYMSSHYNAFGQTTSATSVPNNSMAMSSAATQRLYIADANYTTNESFIQYLQQQYANGTPVTIWYVLATPTTGIVNEPLRKIGNYADTVSGITIPTTTGKDSFDVPTTLKPSEVSLSYTGWHDVNLKEWDGSQWQ